MSVLEVWRVKYLQLGEEKSQSFNWFEFKRLKKFFVEHEVTSVVFIAKACWNHLSIESTTRMSMRRRFPKKKS